jgi:nickel/cobalt transporter (NicO) family protein
MKRFGVVLGVAAAVWLTGTAAAFAHPLGNFTINTYAGLRVQPDRVSVRYVVDRAEIPAFQERPRVDTNRDGAISRGESDAYAARSCAALSDGLRLEVASERTTLAVGRGLLEFVPGAAGLQTMRLTCDLESHPARATASRSVSFRDGNFAGRVGWHEITVIGDGTTIAGSDVPAHSVSEELTHYPQDLLSSPLDVRSANAEFRPGGSALTRSDPVSRPSLLPRGIDAPTRAFTSFLARRSLTVPFAIAALLIAVALGAVHALAPGHGKTVMAAYLVGRRGSFRDGALIAMTVTATHTAGVLALGVALSVSASASSERVYPFLGLASGAMLAAIGCGLLVRAARQRPALAVAGAHGHDHPHPHEPVMSKRGLAAMGLAGGMVPSPSAVIVLLGAIALGRAWLGVALVIAYGAGMALTLSGAGLLLAKARTLAEQRTALRSPMFLDRLMRLAPLVTGAVIVAVGLTLALRGIAQI